jgi:hypothetical protein
VRRVAAGGRERREAEGLKVRAGYHSQPFLDIIAELLEIKKQSGKRGPKHKKRPPYWLEIGIDFKKLRDAGVSYEKACEELRKKWGAKNTIQKAVAFFQKAQKEHDEIQ